MPTYDYRCKNEECGKDYEAIQKITEEPYVTCPNCMEDTLVKKIWEPRKTTASSQWVRKK